MTKTEMRDRSWDCVLTARSTLQSDHRQSPAPWPGPSTMMFLRFALLSAAAWPTAFVAAAEPADAEARAAALAREKQEVAQELARSQTALRETQDTLAKQSAEIGAIRAENAATRIQLGRLQAEAAASHFNPSNLPSAEAVVALEGERTAHRATKAGLNQRETQVQGLVAERTKLESEIRVARASAELASNTARAELRQTQTTLEAARAEATRLAAETLALQGRFATLEREAKAARQPTPADLAAMQIQERQLTALEQELTSTRNLLAQTEARIKSLQETNALLQRELTAATAAARMQDRPTITEEELAQLRIRAAAARELEQQVQQLETEKAAAMAGRGSATGDEVPRLEAARAEAEHKLNTVLRSYTLVARERDAWREQVQQLSVARDSARTAPATTAEVATETVGRTAARANPAPRPVSFSGPEDPAPVVPSTQVDPPRSVTLGQPAFSHRIAPGETLAAIARRYYGNPKRWPEIVAANRDVLRDQRSFAAGKMIRIP